MKRPYFALILGLIAAVAPAHRGNAAVLERLRGEVAVRVLETSVVVGLDESGDGVADRLFVADLGYRFDGGLPEGRLGSGQVLASPSRLVVIGDDTAEVALSFGLTDGDSARPRERGKPFDAALAGRDRVFRVEVGRGLTAMGGAVAGLRLDDIAEADGSVLDLRLARQRLAAGSRADGVDVPLDPALQAILKTIYHQDENPPNTGGPGCGANCSITCGDGSYCSVSCAGVRCASCSCPASCSCQ